MAVNSESVRTGAKPRRAKPDRLDSHAVAKLAVHASAATTARASSAVRAGAIRATIDDPLMRIASVGPGRGSDDCLATARDAAFPPPERTETT